MVACGEYDGCWRRLRLRFCWHASASIMSALAGVGIGASNSLRRGGDDGIGEVDPTFGLKMEVEIHSVPTPSKPLEEMNEAEVRAWKDRLQEEGRRPQPFGWAGAPKTHQTPIPRPGGCDPRGMTQRSTKSSSAALTGSDT